MVPVKRWLPPHKEENASKKPALSKQVIQPSKKVAVTLSSRSSLCKLKRLWHSDKEAFYGWFEENNDDINVFVTRLDSTFTVQTTTHRLRASTVESYIHPAMLHVVRAISTTGNGDCIYNAISILLRGSECYSQAVRFVTVCSLVKHKQLFYAYIRQNLVHIVNLDIPQEYDRILQKALTPLAWAEDYHIQALSLIPNMPIFSYNVWRNSADIFYNDPTMTCDQLASCFANRREGCNYHVLYCAPSHYFVIQESGLSALPRPPICIQLLYSHFTALMYIDLTAIQHLPVPYYRPFTAEM